MKFRLDRDVLAEAVAWTARTLPARPTVPVLAGLRMDAADGQVTLSAFDYEVSGRVTVEADVAGEGTALVSGRLLADICRSLPPRPVDVSVDGAKAVLTCATARFTLLTLPVDEYPDLPDMPESTGTVDGATFADAVSQVAVAAGRDDMLPMLTGIRVEIEDDTLTLAATDRYRLAVRDLTWRPQRAGLSAVALVPARTLADTSKSMGAAEVTIALSESGQDTLMGFESGGRRTTTRLLEGEFPKYRSLFPSESTTTAWVETAPLIDAVKRVALVAERNTPVHLKFSTGQVVLEAGTGDEAQASESLGAGVKGDDFGIGFNPGYLLDGLNAIEAPVAHFAFTQPNRPAVIQGSAALEGEPGGDYRYLLMPVRLSG